MNITPWRFKTEADKSVKINGCRLLEHTVGLHGRFIDDIKSKIALENRC